MVKAQYGDWQMSCDTPPGASFEQCAIIQNVTAEDQPNVGLSVIVLKTADQQARLLRVLAPLGVLLPNGLGLNVDGTDMGRVAFVRCLPNGCVAEVVMDDALLKILSEGTERDIRGVQDARGRHRHPGLAQRLPGRLRPVCRKEPARWREQRNDQRHRTLKPGLIVFNDGYSTIECMVRNLSEGGAQLKVESLIGIPDTFRPEAQGRRHRAGEDRLEAWERRSGSRFTEPVPGDEKAGP